MRPVNSLKATVSTRINHNATDIGVIFDVGGTLLERIDPPEETMAKGLSALIDAIRKVHPNIEQVSFRNTFMQIYNDAYETAQTTCVEVDFRKMVCDSLSLQGILTNCQLEEEYEKAYYASELLAYRKATKVEFALETLASRGIRLAALSNAPTHWIVEQLLSIHKLEHFFDKVESSAKIRYRKPHSNAFLAVMGIWNICPENIVVVGDTFETDVAGADAMGVKTIWLNPTQPPRYQGICGKNLEDVVEIILRLFFKKKPDTS